MKIKTPFFSRNDVAKLFPKESKNHINTQLYRMVKRDDLVGVKRGYYLFQGSKVDEFFIANRLYTPSYISLESVLNITGIIPDITSVVTNVTTITSIKLSTPVGNFVYSKISEKLFFGYTSILDRQSGLYYDIASPEKALLDFIYIRRIQNLIDSRVDISNLNKEVLNKYSIYFPKWVRKVIKDA